VTVHVAVWPKLLRQRGHCVGRSRDTCRLPTTPPRKPNITKDEVGSTSHRLLSTAALERNTTYRIARRSNSPSNIAEKSKIGNRKSEIGQNGGACCPFPALVGRGPSPALSSLRSLRFARSQLLDLLTLGLWSKLGRLTHYAFDAVLCKWSLHAVPLASVRQLTVSFPTSLRIPCGNETLDRPDVSLKPSVTDRHAHRAATADEQADRCPPLPGILQGPVSRPKK
jgi:hypothetical protein